MKHNLLASALLCASVFAQNPNIAVYPGAAPTNSDLLVASDFYATTLVSAQYPGAIRIDNLIPVPDVGWTYDGTTFSAPSK